MVHWIWILVALSSGTCLGYVAAGLLRNINPGGDYFPSVEDADHLYRPRQSTHWKPRVEK
jgi:hypothetical protein